MQMEDIRLNLFIVIHGVTFLGCIAEYFFYSFFFILTPLYILHCIDCTRSERWEFTSVQSTIDNRQSTTIEDGQRLLMPSTIMVRRTRRNPAESEESRYTYSPTLKIYIPSSEIFFTYIIVTPTGCIIWRAHPLISTIHLGARASRSLYLSIRRENISA